MKALLAVILILFLFPLAYATVPSQPYNPVPNDNADIYKNYVTLFWSSGIDPENDAVCNNYQFDGGAIQTNAGGGITERNLNFGLHNWNVQTCEFNVICTANCSAWTDWQFTVETPDEPVLTFISPTATKTMSLGDIETIVLTIRNPNPGAMDVNLSLSSDSILNNWVWFDGHQYDESRQVLTLSLMAGEVQRVVIDVLAGGVGSYFGNDGLIVTAAILGGAQPTSSLNIRVMPREGSLFTEAPDLSSISLIIIAMLASLIKINKKRSK